MLKDIRIHLDTDESQQSQNEQQLAAHVNQARNENINTLQRFLPSLLPYIQQNKLMSFGLFCNKYKEYNIVDYGLGRAFYGLHPKQEVYKQVQDFWQTPIFVQTEQKNSLEEQSDEHLNKPVELLVILGLGLGYQLLDAVKHKRSKHIVIYEPEIQFFLCSTSVIDWKTLLTEAKKNNIGLYFQLQKDGRDILADIEQFQERFGLREFCLFKHYNHPIFDTVCSQLENRSWGDLREYGLRFSAQQDGQLYNSPWAPRVVSPKSTLSRFSQQRFEQNLNAFKRYFPHIHREFVDYQPEHWKVIETVEGEINLVRDFDSSPFHIDSPKLEGEASYLNFNHHPNKDGLVLGYKGNKLRDYTHYRFVNKAEKYLDQLEEEQGSLPNTIKSLILFGLGTGYQLEQLAKYHDIEMLFVCEPNRDYFYASLYAIDWVNLLEKVDQAEGRIYLNIGDNTSQLFNDLLAQFYSIGPHVLSNTYFYQGYYNEYLVELIAQLREQLKIVISYGEYFDHARYGIAQTKHGITNGIGHMVASPEKIISDEIRELPIFLVGNGPSLDKAFDVIREYQDKVVVVSCGTALQSLYKKGITPDFHAEIEQNRATFDWISRVGDFDYLKNITLVSCNGIHPDTSALFKDTLIAFKEGESSTVAILDILGANNHQILQFAFPTVANFALNFFSVAGMQQLYLFGIDLGFHDVGNHHSKLSGYYDKTGKEISNFLDKLNTSIRVPGNFSKTVFTKHEFKVSKSILEQALSKVNCSVYNTSDGAKIEGTVPLHLEHILITSSSQHKQAFLEHWPSKCFIRYEHSDFEQRFSTRYNQALLTEQLDELLDSVELAKLGGIEAEALIVRQTRMLHSAIKRNKSLFFYYMQGTMMFANVVLSRIAMHGHFDKDETIKREFLQDWKYCIERIVRELSVGADEYDVSTSFTFLRQKRFLKEKLKNVSLLYISNKPEVVEATKKIASAFEVGVPYQCVSKQQFFERSDAFEPAFMLYFSDGDDQDNIKQLITLVKKRKSISLMVYLTNESSDDFLAYTAPNIGFICGLDEFSSVSAPIEQRYDALVVRSIYQLFDIDKFDFLIRKKTIFKGQKLSLDGPVSIGHFYDGGMVILGTSEQLGKDKRVLSEGTRLKALGTQLVSEDLVSYVLDEEQMNTQLHNWDNLGKN